LQPKKKYGGDIKKKSSPTRNTDAGVWGVKPLLISIQGGGEKSRKTIPTEKVGGPRETKSVQDPGKKKTKTRRSPAHRRKGRAKPCFGLKRHRW